MGSKENQEKSAVKKIREVEFEKMKQEMIQKGYEEKEIIISPLKANIMAVVITLPLVILGALLYIGVHKEIGETFTGMECFIFVALYLVGIVIHEFIHGITWSTYCKEGWKAIHFGMIWAYLTPYCSCKECLKHREYVIGTLMPTIIIGGLSYIMAMIFGASNILFYSLLMIVGGGGDLYIVYLSRKYKEAFIIDHPSKVGCVAFVPKV